MILCHGTSQVLHVLVLGISAECAPPLYSWNKLYCYSCLLCGANHANFCLSSSHCWYLSSSGLHMVCYAYAEINHKIGYPSIANSTNHTMQVHMQGGSRVLHTHLFWGKLVCLQSRVATDNNGNSSNRVARIAYPVDRWSQVKAENLRITCSAVQRSSWICSKARQRIVSSQQKVVVEVLEVCIPWMVAALE